MRIEIVLVFGRCHGSQGWVPPRERQDDRYSLAYSPSVSATHTVNYVSAATIVRVNS